MFLANRINEVTKLSPKQRSDLTTVFVKKLIKSDSDVVPAAIPNLLAKNFPKFHSKTETRISDLNFIARRVRKAMRFALDESLASAIRTNAHKYNTEKLVEAFNFIRLPYPLTWIEFSQTVVGGGGKTLNCGILFEDMEIDGERAIKVHLVQEFPKATPEYTGFPSYRPGLDNFIIRKNMQSDPDVWFFWKNTGPGYHSCMADTLMLILLFMNSRRENKPGLVAIGDEMDDPSIPIKGKREHSTAAARMMTLRPITFDVSRTITKGNSPEEIEQERALRYSVIRMGHFKLLKTGLHWWFPHEMRVTGPKDEENPDSENACIARNVLKERNAVTTEPSEQILPHEGFAFPENSMP